MASFRTLCLVFLICIIVLTHVDHVDANIFTYTIGRTIQKMTSKRGNPEKYRKKKGCMAIPEEERQSIYETQAGTSSEETKQSEALVACPSFTLYFSTDRGPYMSARQASNFITFPPLV